MKKVFFQKTEFLFSFFPFKREETEQKVSVNENSAQKPIFPFFPCKLFCEPEV